MPLRQSPKNKRFQNLGSLFVKCLWRMSYMFWDMDVTYRCYKFEVLWRYFTRFTRHCLNVAFVLKLWEKLFWRKLFNNCFDSNANVVLWNRLCNGILHASKTCWETCELTRPTHFQIKYWSVSKDWQMVLRKLRVDRHTTIGQTSNTYGQTNG